MQHRHQGEPLPFLVMELLEGRNLQQILDERGRLDPGELVWMAGQLGRALDAAHKQGIVHRDLKPSNVFIAEDEEGRVAFSLTLRPDARPLPRRDPYEGQQSGG